jgi:hypothetical protein
MFPKWCDSLSLVGHTHTQNKTLTSISPVGELVETSKKNLLRIVSLQDGMQEGPTETGAPPKEW